MEKKHVNLIIATPGHSVMTQYLESLLATISVLNKNGITWGFTSKYSSHVADARERTISGDVFSDPSETRPFNGDITYDKIMWIDSDIAWKPEDVLKLYDSEYDIVSGAYLQPNGDCVAYKELLKEGMKYEDVLKMTDPIRVEGAGFGFIMIRSGVFESLSKPWFQSPIMEWNSEEGDLYRFTMIGEDLSFCKRATDAGFEIWFDPTVRVTHHKMMKITWDGIKP